MGLDGGGLGVEGLDAGYGGDVDGGVVRPEGAGETEELGGGICFALEGGEARDGV